MAAVVSAGGYRGPPELTVARAFTSWTLDLPVLAAVLLAVALYLAGLRSAPVRELTYLALLAPGWVFFWTLLRVDPVPKAYPYLVTMWVTGTEVVGDAILGLAIMADQNLIAGPYYRALGRPWGPSLRADQVIGGGALWLIGDLIGLPFLAAMLIQMMREDEREARAIDAELDAAEAGPGAADSGHGTAGTAQPWWESDPRFAGRFRRPGGG